MYTCIQVLFSKELKGKTAGHRTYLTLENETPCFVVFQVDHWSRT